RTSFATLSVESEMINSCLMWLRNKYPDEPLSVYTRDYYTLSPFLRQHIRLSHINADFDPMGITPTLYPYDLTDIMPRYMIPYHQTDRDFWSLRNFKPVVDSPLMDNRSPCLWSNPNTLSYGFAISLEKLISQASAPPFDLRYPLPLRMTTPLDHVSQQPGQVRIGYLNESGEAQVLVVQEVAWPGWQVWVNGQSARLESIGQLIGVVIPAGSDVQNIVFEFTSPLLQLGGIITLVTSLFCIGYLLYGERLLKRRQPGQPTRLEITTSEEAPLSG
ncbi:MAG: hypothetical protein H7X77_10495, partial [Anaerolineae bacterium]|nr:hypothetical protein [Anaerolineae bacterium]